jgi:hypothetical protein
MVAFRSFPAEAADAGQYSLLAIDASSHFCVKEASEFPEASSS